jgi:hypothetical protein
MAPRRSNRIALRSFRSIPAFLRLPQEIRDYIYEMLVTTAWTYDYIDGETAYCMYRPIFDQCPAILLVNKRISAEARRIFYTKNEFIVFKLLGRRGQTLKDYISDVHLPYFNILYNRDLVDPVLTVTIRSLCREKDDHMEDKEFTLITTTEAIHNIIEQFWTYIMEGEPFFDQTLYINLHFRNKNPSTRLYLAEHILRPWDQVQGFKKVSLTGDIDEALARHLEDHMIMGPHPNDIDRNLELYQRLAEDHQKRKLYRHAAWFWAHLYFYWEYHDYNDTDINTGLPRSLFKRDIKSTLVAAQPLLLKMMLEKIKCSLLLQNYGNCSWDVYEAKEWIWDERYVNHFGLDQQGLWMVKAKVLLCSCLASVGAHDTDGSVAQDLKAAVKAFMKGTAQSQKGSRDVHDRFCWAIDNYFVNLGSPLRYTQKQWLKSKNHTDKEVSREGWLTFWEGMNSPIWPE